MGNLQVVNTDTELRLKENISILKNLIEDKDYIIEIQKKISKNYKTRMDF